MDYKCYGLNYGFYCIPKITNIARLTLPMLNISDTTKISIGVVCMLAT